MKYDFDEIIERRGTDCIKYDVMDRRTGRDDLMALWVADMDFRTPDFIVDALRSRVDHQIYGYTAIPQDYFKMISGWVSELHGVVVDPSHIRFIPGIVRGIAMVLMAFCRPEDKIVIQPPVYHPFRNVPVKNGYQVLDNPLIPRYSTDEGPECDRKLIGYDMDFAGLEKLIEKEHPKVLILSNPHNPAGICWSEETLRRLAEITSAAGMLVISDEIHAEMAYGRHIPYLSVSEAAASNSITFMAPSKTFNIAGIVSSYCIVEDESLRDRFFAWLEANEFDSPAIFSTVATVAAYLKGAQWRREMLDYVKSNIDFVDEYLTENIPGGEIRALKPQASFLVWLDCRSLMARRGWSQDDLVKFFLDAGLFMNDGSMFGQGGTGFMRLNVGCPRSILRKALERISAAL